MSEVNKPPKIEAFNSYPSLFVKDYGSGTGTLMVHASDPEGNPLTYTFEINGQINSTNQPFGNIYAPKTPGEYELKVTVSDGINKTSKSIKVTVIDPKNITKKLIEKGVIGLTFHNIYTEEEIKELPPDQRPDYFKKKAPEEIWKSSNIYYSSFEEFKKFITALEHDNFHIISLKTLVDAIYEQNDAKIPEKAVFIAFDDGAKSQYKAIKWLAERGHPVALFIIGKTLLENENHYLTPEQILELTSFKDSKGNPLVEIGSHSTTHNYPSLGFNPKEIHTKEELKKYKVRINFELDNGKKILENLLGIPIIGFAAPYGEGFNKEQVSDRIVFPMLKNELISFGYKYNRSVRWEYINYPLLADPYTLSAFMPTCIDDASKLHELIDSIFRIEVLATPYPIHKIFSAIIGKTSIDLDNYFLLGLGNFKINETTSLFVNTSYLKNSNNEDFSLRSFKTETGMISTENLSKSSKFYYGSELKYEQRISRYQDNNKAVTERYVKNLIYKVPLGFNITLWKHIDSEGNIFLGGNPYLSLINKKFNWEAESGFGYSTRRTFGKISFTVYKENLPTQIETKSLGASSRSKEDEENIYFVAEHYGEIKISRLWWLSDYIAYTMGKADDYRDQSFILDLGLNRALLRTEYGNLFFSTAINLFYYDSNLSEVEWEVKPTLGLGWKIP